MTNLNVAEYERVCNVCGKVWHSLVDREKQLKTNALCNVCGSFSTCGTGAGQAQYTRNIDANIDTINELKKCPQCGSNNYTEKVIYYEKQM
jgi:hypothetical protein